jgi:site-specific recombinase XerD
MEGKLPHPLHTRIDTPRVYRGELLPKAMAWSQVQALLASIDQSEPHGLRDYTLLLLMATYGLRSCEVVALTLDDIDWREAVIRVPQRKNRQRLPLPLTDEAGDALHRYLKHARPCSRVRELFLRTYPPRGPLVPTAVWYILNTRIRNSQLEMGPKGTHCLRHALAIRLLQQGVSTKSIGDVLSHRDLESTAGYLRFAVEELRDVGLAVPKGTFKAASSPPTIRPKFSPLTKSRSKLLGKNKQRFRSGLGPAIQRYVALKQALGREFSAEQRILLDWDASLYRHQRVARRVSASAFQHWAKTLVHLSPQGQRRRLQIVRNFLLFHARDHTVDFIPDLDTFPKRRPPRAPRLLTEVEMARVLAVTEQLSPSVENPLRSETLRTGFILLYCCGLRRGELLRLKIADLDLKQNLLHIEKTKFHKSRLVPFHQSVAQELVRFLALRRRKHMPVGNDSYLVFSARRQSPHGVFVGSAFIGLWQRLCLAAGVQDGRGGPPRVHDLRHSMATNALQRWYDQGLDINAKLPHLATYLGHVSVASTHYYLRFTAQVRESASERFRQLCMPLFDDGGKA